MLQKALVIGCPSAGKSTFARQLRDKTSLPLYYLDMLWHKPNRTTTKKRIFDKKLKKLLAQEQWIIDGNYCRTLERRIKACDTIFFLDLPIDICLAGAAARIGTPREDLPWVETEFDEDFKQWISDFPHRDLPLIKALLAKYQNEKDIHVFRSRAEIDSYWTHWPAVPAKPEL